MAAATFAVAESFDTVTERRSFAVKGNTGLPTTVTIIVPAASPGWGLAIVGKG
jgi:hypothetical protein